MQAVARGPRLTTTAEHNVAGQRPITADAEEADSQASGGNRQRAGTLQAEGHKVTSALGALLLEPYVGPPVRRLCQIRAETRSGNDASAGQKRTVRVCKAVGSPYAITRRQRLFPLASESGSLGSRRTLGSPSAARGPADELRGLASRRSPQVQQRSTATSPEISRLRWTSMDRQQALKRKFSNVGSVE